MELTIIASGSNGNSCLVEHGGASILVDAGLSCKEIESRLAGLGKCLSSIDAVLLTHSHSDHTRGAGIISRRYGVPIYMQKQTLGECHKVLGDMKHKLYTPCQEFLVNGVGVKPIPTSHSVASCGFVVGKFGIFTDTGVVTREMEKILPRLECILLESNHDPEMVRDGPYPPFLKKWILGDTGHLSNEAASSFVKESGTGISQVFLGHLSANNNTPGKARETFESIVSSKVQFEICSRDKATGKWEL